jgi:hypothetical protein
MSVRFVKRPVILVIAAGLCGVAAVVGCNDETDQRATAGNSPAALPQTGKAEKTGTPDFNRNRVFQVLPVAKFAGRVTIDGKPPREGGKLFVFLTDPEHLDENARGTLPKLYTVCDADGRFAFGTYDLKNKNDGVVAGKYVVTFAQLRRFIPKNPNAKAKTASAREKRPGGYEKYSLPDDLQNLYSDPDRNAKSPTFRLDLQPPGKDDYQFDLAVAGKAPLPKAAPHAVTYMVLPK